MAERSVVDHSRSHRRMLGICWLIYAIFRLIVTICLLVFSATATVMFWCAPGSRAKSLFVDERFSHCLCRNHRLRNFMQYFWIFGWLGSSDQSTVRPDIGAYRGVPVTV
jgi:hypothetical protein